MAQLVLDDNDEEGKLWNRHILFRAHDLIRVSDAANVLHGAIFVVGAHHVIDLREGVSGAKIALVEVKSGLGDPKDELGSQELSHGLAHEDSLRHIHGIRVFIDHVWTCADSVEVGGDPGSGLEVIDRNVSLLIVKVEEPVDTRSLQDMAATVLSITAIKACLDGIADGAPLRRAQDDELHLSLHVGLVKAWEHSEAVEGLELGVEVLLSVGAIGEGVKTDAILVIGCQILELNSVPSEADIFDLKRDNLILEASGINGQVFIVDL